MGPSTAATTEDADARKAHATGALIEAKSHVTRVTFRNEWWRNQHTIASAREKGSRKPTPSPSASALDVFNRDLAVLTSSACAGNVHPLPL